MVEVDPFYCSGQIGPCLEVFKEARANRRIYDVLPTLKKGTCNYTAFAPLDKLTFDPDVLVLTGRARKMEIVLRSMSWTTGTDVREQGHPGARLRLDSRVPLPQWQDQLLRDRSHLRPHRPGSGHRGERHGLGALGRLPTMVENLQEMPFVLPAYEDGRDNYSERFDRVTGA